MEILILVQVLLSLLSVCFFKLATYIAITSKKANSSQQSRYVVASYVQGLRKECQQETRRKIW